METNSQRLEFTAIAELARRFVEQPPGPDTGNLVRFEYSVFSQNGEDGVIAEIFRRIGEGSRTFVEIGANAWGGNTNALADIMGWRGIMIEALPDRAEELRRKYRGFPGIIIQQALVTTTWMETFDAAPYHEVDLFSIDVDGDDFWLWRSMRLVRPRVFIVEYNSHIPPEQALVQPERREHVPWHWDFFGASVLAFIALGRELGYTLVHTDSHGVNAIFVRDDQLPHFADIDLTRIPYHGPNFDGRGRYHGADPEGRTYLDLRSLGMDVHRVR